MKRLARLLKKKLKYVEGIRRGDAATMAAFFTEDAILLPPNSEIAHASHYSLDRIEKSAALTHHWLVRLNIVLPSSFGFPLMFSFSSDADLGTAAFSNDGVSPKNLSRMFMYLS